MISPNMTPDQKNQIFKKMLAEVIGVDDPDSLTDEQMIAKHKAHMAMANDLADAMGSGKIDPDPVAQVAGLPPEIAKAMRVPDAPKTTMPNTASLGSQITSLIATERIANPALSYAEARDLVRYANPALFNTQKPALVNRAALKAEKDRAAQVAHLVREKMESGAGGTGPDAYTNCYQLVRVENPALFSGMKQQAPGQPRRVE